MKRFVFATAALGFLVSTGASAADYYIIGGSDLNNVRHIGGSLIPEVNDYQPHDPGGLDPSNPANWTLMTTSQPGVGIGGYAPNTSPGTAPTRGGVSAAIGGQLSVVGGVVTAASLQMLAGEALRYAHFQSCTTNANPPPTYSSCLATDLVAQNLVWTWNGTHLLHQADPYTSVPNHTDSTRTAYCAPSGGDPFFGGASGTAITGQCGVLRSPVSNSAIGSMWNWDGMPANYYVIDSQMALYHTGTNKLLNIGGAAGHQGVVWDLTGFVDGVGGVIKAYVVAAAVSNSTSTTAPGNNTGVAATYTLYLTPVPVPAAVWMFGGALGLLGYIRRRSKAAV